MANEPVTTKRDPPAPDLIDGADGRPRCFWATGDDPLYTAYHDHEWGRPVVDETQLFEKLCLEGFQAGLSWLTILRKREAFRTAFSGFDPDRVTTFGDRDIERLMQDSGIVRHRGKIVSAINNAQRAIDLRQDGGSLAAYSWSFEPKSHAPTTRADVASITDESTAMSKDLKRRGWSFVGPTTVYAFMQAMGLVNDHLMGCWVRNTCEQGRSNLHRPR